MKLIGFLILLSILFSGCSDNRKLAVYNSQNIFVNELLFKMKINESLIKKNINKISRAQGIILFPNITKFSLAYGYETGEGILFKIINGKLSKPIFVNLKSGTIGYSVGYSTRTDLVVIYDNDYLYVANGSAGLRIIDVTDPENPVETAQYVTDGDAARGISVVGSYAYVVADMSLRIINVSNPASPVEIGYYGVVGIQSVTVSDNHAYIGTGVIMGGDGGFRIIDVSNPASPTEVAIYEADEVINDITIRGNYAYLVGGTLWDGPDNLHIIDVSNPETPIALTVHSGGAFGIDVSGSYAYIVGFTLRIIDVSDVLNPVDAGFFSTGGNLPRQSDVAVSGNYAYVAAGDSGMYIIQNHLVVVSNDEAPSIPESFVLQQNYPNPFNPITTISYSLPEQSKVKLTVFDIRGREVTTLEQSEKPPGNYEVQWSGMDRSGNPVSTGVYFARLDAGKFSQTIKMLFLK